MYQGNPNLRAANEAISMSMEEINEYIKCQEDILYFAEHYYYIQTIDDGRIKIPLWEFQKKMLKVFVDPSPQKHVVVLSARQMSKTTVTSIYLLHKALFGKEMNMAILANNERTSRDILGRIQMAYLNLPLWLQKGIADSGWNKSSMTLENGVKIIAASTSSNSIRGMTINCVGEDSNITLRSKNTGEIKKVTMKELELILREKNISINVDSIELLKNDEWKVLTPEGYQPFSGLSKSKKSTMKLLFDDGNDLVCTEDHKIFYLDTEKKESASFKVRDIIKTVKNDKQIKSIISDNGIHDVYDLINVGIKHRFIANDITVSNCILLDEAAFVPDYVWNDFYNSVLPTISSGKTSQIIMVSTPKGMNHFYKIYKDAVDGRSNFRAIKVPWWERPDRDEEWKKKTMMEMGGDVIRFQQEHNCPRFDTIINIDDEEIEIGKFFDEL